MKILAFGIAKEILGAGVIDIAGSGETDVAALQALLEVDYPQLKKLAAYAIAVNGEYAAGNAVITTHDEIAIIPPVSGG